MSIVHALAVLVWNTGCLALVVFGLPGTWAMLAGAAALERLVFRQPWIGSWTLGACAALAALAELFEFLSSTLAARRVGASRRASVAALVGAISGAIAGTLLLPIPVFGTLLGATAGAFLLTYAAERWQGEAQGISLRRGTGAAVGSAMGMIAKWAVAACVWLILAVALFA